MTVDVSARANVTGITTEFKDSSSGATQFLPQRLAVFAQGASSVVYSTTKRPVTSELEGGGIYGFGSPIDLILEQLFPDNGDGVGTIPVTVYPLADDPAGVPAQGDITPSGTTTAARSYRVRVAGRLSNAFVTPVGAITGTNLNDLLRRMGDAVAAVLRMPVTVTYTYGSVTASAFSGGTGNGTITALSVTGNPKPGAYLLKLNTVVANGGVWTLTDPDGVVLSTSITMTPGASQATVINVAGLQFTLTDGSTDFGTGVQTTITVPATKVNHPAKWKGASGNAIKLEVIGDSAEVTFAITQPTGGLNNPSVSAALAQVGDIWETMLLNALNITDTVALDAFSTFGEGRWGELVHKQCVAFVGVTDAAVATATAVPDSRKTDRTNCALPAPGSPNLPCVVAARELARIIKVANNNPPTGYGAQSATGLIPGLDSEQWNYATRDLALKAGCSTVQVRDGVVTLADVVTFYHPTGDPNPAYRYVVNIVKLQNTAYNFALEFESQEWASAPLIPDDQATVNPNARKPSQAKAAAAAILDGLGDQAIISDPTTSKKNTTAAIDSGNPNRLNIVVPFSLSGNTEIKDVIQRFSFFFGGATA